MDQDKEKNNVAILNISIAEDQLSSLHTNRMQMNLGGKQLQLTVS